jgi:hypothetical protein
MGGLGNQMFQYAAAKALSHYHKTPLKADLSFLEDSSNNSQITKRDFELKCFTAQIEVATKEEIEVLDKPISLKDKVLGILGFRIREVYLEKSFKFDSDFFSIKPKSLLVGYWQSEKYFCRYRDLILSDFSWRIPLGEINLKVCEKIVDSSSVSIHIRRGDYVTNSAANNFHGICEADYYLRAISLIEHKIINPKYFVFSDDLEASREILGHLDHVEFIDWNGSGQSFQDMRLMSMCKHNIIANSSFSWWGAWLNNNPGRIVIAPKKWFNKTDIDTSDLIPESWTLV